MDLGIKNARIPFSFSQLLATTFVIKAHMFKLIPPVKLSPENKCLSMHIFFNVSLYFSGRYFQSTHGGLPAIKSNLSKVAIFKNPVIILVHILSQFCFSRIIKELAKFLICLNMLSFLFFYFNIDSITLTIASSSCAMTAFSISTILSVILALFFIKLTGRVKFRSPFDV